MDKEKAALIAREYVEFIRKKDPNIKKAYIFGSFAKGTDREDSDIDLAIIFKNLTDPYYRRPR